MNSSSDAVRGLRIVFAGTPEFAASHLAALLAAGCQVVAVYTQPDRPAGRGKKLAPSPVKQLALDHGIEVCQPLNFRDEADCAALAVLQPDLMIVVAYGLLLPQRVLDIPRLGCINVHASLLPRWRGAAPIQRAIEAGDAETGICIMQMEAGLDTGPVLRQHRCAIAPEDTGGSLHDRLAEQGPPELLAALADIALGSAQAVPQDHAQANYAHKLGKDDARLDFNRPAQTLHDKVRAFNPFPVAWCQLPDGERLRVWAAALADGQRAGSKIPGTVLRCDRDGLAVACGDDSVLLLTELQLPNRNRMAVRDLLNGNLLPLQSGDTLS